MRLLDLDPEFLRHVEKDGHQYTQIVESIDEAQGVWFLCPACFVKNNGPVGTHMVMCWSRSRGTPAHVEPLPGRWKMVGTGLHDLTLNADPPSVLRSVQLTAGCMWHGFITNGEVTTS